MLSREKQPSSHINTCKIFKTFNMKSEHKLIFRSEIQEYSYTEQENFHLRGESRRNESWYLCWHLTVRLIRIIRVVNKQGGGIIGRSSLSQVPETFGCWAQHKLAWTQECVTTRSVKYKTLLGLICRFTLFIRVIGGVFTRENLMVVFKLTKSLYKSAFRIYM